MRIIAYVPKELGDNYRREHISFGILEEYEIVRLMDGSHVRSYWFDQNFLTVKTVSRDELITLLDL